MTSCDHKWKITHRGPWKQDGISWEYRDVERTCQLCQKVSVKTEHQRRNKAWRLAVR